MIGPVSDLATALELAAPADLRWWYRLMPAESHVSMPHRTIYDALETIFSDYAIPESMVMAGDVARLERHLAGAAARYGYDIRPPESLVNRMGYMQLRFFDRPEKAVEIFRRNLELYPESPNTYDSLADALEAADRLSEALRNREEAVRRAMEAGDPRAATFRRKLEALRKRVEGRPAGGTCGTAEVAELIGIPPEAVRRRIQRGTLLAVRSTGGEYRLPRVQFSEAGVIEGGLAQSEAAPATSSALRSIALRMATTAPLGTSYFAA